MRGNLVTASGPRISPLVIVLLLFSLAPFSPSSLRSVLAQVSTAIMSDNTLPTPTTVNPVGSLYNINGGTISGTNQFHSFDVFSVGPGDIASFNGPIGITNILGRVTGLQSGLQVSSIYGTIQSTIPGANLFLMNPAGFLFGPGATVNVGSMVHFTTADYLRLAEIGGSSAGIFHADLSQPIVLTNAPVAAFGFLGSNPEAIRVEGSSLTLSPATGLSFVGGPITIGMDSESETLASISAPGGRIDLVSVASPGEILYPSLQRASNINGQSFTAMGNITISDFTSVDVSGSLDQGDGHGGAIRIRGGQLVMDNFSFLTASTQGEVAGDTPGVSVLVDGRVTLRNVSGIVTGTGSGAGRDGGVEIMAANVEITDGSFIITGSSGPAAAGDITIQADTISLTGGLPDEGLFTNITTIGGGSVEGGTISLSGRGSSGQTLSISDQGQILTSSSSGRGGDIRIEMDHVTISGGASLVATAADSASTGDILVTAKESFSLTGQSPGGAGSAISSISNLSPANISITTGQFLLSEAAQINGSTNASQGGQIGISATGSIAIQNNASITSTSNIGTGALLELSAPTILIDQSTLSARSAGTADGGMITAHATNGNLTLDHGSVIASSTGGSGTGGVVEVTASDSVLVAGGSRIESNSFSTSSGGAGSVTVRGENLVALSGAGSRLLTEARGTGDGGNILVAANQVQLADGAVISATSTGAGAGGSITIDAGNTFASNASTVSSTATQAQGGDIAITTGQSATLNNGSNISANSSGTGNAGSIDIAAGQRFIATNSSVTTQANHASGGTIKITTVPSGTVQLTNSTISASVLDGTGGGGSVNIDPLYVLLQNSQILAQAVQGPGGNITITITNGGLFLPDANSVISASSQFGVNGTVTIQSPNAPISGQIQPLGKSPLIATSLLNQHCASLADGQFSSFTVAGRDSLPTGPDNWLASPLALATRSAGMVLGVKAEGMRPVVRGERLEGETVLLSLRQIAPAGFLTQAFAVDWSASCQS